MTFIHFETRDARVSSGSAGHVLVQTSIDDKDVISLLAQISGKLVSEDPDKYEDLRAAVSKLQDEEMSGE